MQWTRERERAASLPVFEGLHGDETDDTQPLWIRESSPRTDRELELHLIRS